MRLALRNPAAVHQHARRVVGGALRVQRREHARAELESALDGPDQDGVGQLEAAAQLRAAERVRVGIALGLADRDGRELDARALLREVGRAPQVPADLPHAERAEREHGRET